MKRNALTRILCTVLCATMLLGASLMPSANALTILPAPSPNDSSVILRNVTDFFFRNFGLIGFVLDPYQLTMMNQRPSFQWGLGFNEFYDVFTWVMNVWTDSVRITFNYDDRDWLIQLWKGGYGLFFATGGEIGIYTKVSDWPIPHYNAPVSQSDWINMSMTIYNRGTPIFTRPSPYLIGDNGPYWWLSGYRLLSLCTDFYSNPRTNVIMDATLELHSAEMARLFMGSLREKGFRPLAAGGTLSISTPERYVLMPDNKTVRLIWQNINEGWY